MTELYSHRGGHSIEVGEYGLALEDIAGTLAQDAIAITGRERGDMLALAARMSLEGGLQPQPFTPLLLGGRVPATLRIPHASVIRPQPADVTTRALPVKPG